MGGNKPQCERCICMTCNKRGSLCRLCASCGRKYPNLMPYTSECSDHDSDMSKDYDPIPGWRPGEGMPYRR